MAKFSRAQSCELRASSGEGKCLFQPRTLCAHSIESATAEIQYEPGGRKKYEDCRELRFGVIQERQISMTTGEGFISSSAKQKLLTWYKTYMDLTWNISEVIEQYYYCYCYYYY